MQLSTRIRARSACPRARTWGTRPVRVPRATAATVQQQDEATWSAFAAGVSGEWEGVTASFAADGSPLPLPERFVPDAYREWGVELFDWQSQCSCTTEDGQRLNSKLRRLMPTVGCEADAVAFTEEASTASSASDAPATSDGSLVISPGGSYASGPAAFDSEEAPRMRFEACFASPGLSAEGGGPLLAAAGEGGAAPRFRIKVAQNLGRNWADGSWRLDSVELHRERWEGPHTGRQELAGCGGGHPAISKLPATPGEDLEGSWVPAGGVVLTAGAPGGALEASDGGFGLAAGGGGEEGERVIVTRLPLGAWSVVRLGPGAGSVAAEAGALLGSGGRREVASRGYEGGRLVRVALGAEARA